MTRSALLHVLDHATALGPAEVRELEQLAQAFPYCQTAHLLLAKAAHDHGTMLASQRLRRAATYAADRVLLRRLIEAVPEAEAPASEESSSGFLAAEPPPATAAPFAAPAEAVLELESEAPPVLPMPAIAAPSEAAAAPEPAAALSAPAPPAEKAFLKVSLPEAIAASAASEPAASPAETASGTAADAPAAAAEATAPSVAPAIEPPAFAMLKEETGAPAAPPAPVAPAAPDAGAARLLRPVAARPVLTFAAPTSTASLPSLAVVPGAAAPAPAPPPAAAPEPAAPAATPASVAEPVANATIAEAVEAPAEVSSAEKTQVDSSADASAVELAEPQAARPLLVESQPEVAPSATSPEPATVAPVEAVPTPAEAPMPASPTAEPEASPVVSAAEVGAAQPATPAQEPTLSAALAEADAGLPLAAPPIRPPAAAVTARREFDLLDTPLTAPAYLLPGLSDEYDHSDLSAVAQAAARPVLTPAAFTGDAALGYGWGESSRLGWALLPLPTPETNAPAHAPAAPLPPPGEFFPPDALLLAHWAEHRPPAPPLPSSLELVDSFLRKRPSLTRPPLHKITTETLADLSAGSTRPEPEIASETLARILARQGKTARAIEIYERLMVRQPEKMAYFAAEIQQLQLQQPPLS